MDFGKAAFIALYVPLVACAGTASWLFLRNVILPAWSRGELSIHHHGLAMALALGLGMDFVENTYYGLGRVFPSMYPTIHSSYGPMTTIRLLVLSTSIIALGSYAAIVGSRFRLFHVFLGASFLWIGMFAWLTQG